MIILRTKLRNAINKQNNNKNNLTFKLKNITINGAKKGCSGFIINNDNSTVIYVNTEGITWSNQPTKYMYRYAKDDKDYTGYTNRWATGLDNLAKLIVKHIEEEPNEFNEPSIRKNKSI